MKWDESIEGPHLAIAASTSRRIGVLAGPGTGKTGLGLMRRVARLLSEGVSGSRILLISFTRTAAHDLRDKVADLGVEGTDSVRATTLHAYCFGLLQRDAVLAITKRTPRPLMNHEVDLMLRDLNGDFGDIKKRRKLLKGFEAGWARGIEDHPGTASLPIDKAFEGKVIGWLRHHKAMLIGEVIPLAYNYLKTNPLADDRHAFDHLVVDEYQDLNFLEQRLLDLLADDAQVHLCVAGDDDQSIYRFRHANPTGIQNYLDREEVERHEIEICGRCPRVVLSMANSLIAHAPERDRPPLGCLKDNNEGTLAIVQWQDSDEEVQGIVAAVVSDVQTGRRQPGDMLVLAHRQKIGEAIRRQLVDLNVPAHSFFAEEAVRTAEAQEAFALLRLALGEDPVSLRVIVGLGDATGRTDAYRCLTDYCQTNGTSERDVLEQARKGEKLPINLRALLSRFEHAMNVVERFPLDDLPALVDALMPAQVEAVSDLRQLALEVLPDVESAKELLDALIIRITQVDVPASPDYVRIMSLHKSKGLTSPAVFIAGLVEGIVPTLPTGLSEQEEAESVAEQRRLMYVAVTRVADQLVLSYSASMKLALASSMGVRVVRDKIRKYGGELRAPTIASRYLAELGPDAPKAIAGTKWLEGY